MYAAVLLNGFTPDTMLVHPMARLMWIKDPVLREFAIQAGGGSFFVNFTGDPAVLGNKFYNYNGPGLGQGQPGSVHPGPAHVDRKDVWVRNPQRRSGNRSGQEREDPPERVHDAGTQRVQTRSLHDRCQTKPSRAPGSP